MTATPTETSTSPAATADTERARREIEHGKFLAAEGPEATWGWGSPAGRIRARNRAQRIIDGAHLQRGMRALEIGCGTGMFSDMIAQQSGASVVAVDISPDLIDVAKERGLPEHVVKFICARFESSEVEGPFDAVIGSSVLHHLEVRESLVRMFELLKPGGWITFAEPNILNPQVYAERRFRHWKIFDYVSPDEIAFNRFRLAPSLEDIGFDSITITPFDWLHPSTPRPFIPLVRGLGWTLEHMPLLREGSGSLIIAARRPTE